MIRFMVILLGVVLCMLPSPVRTAEEPASKREIPQRDTRQVVPLWPAGVPDSEKNSSDEKVVGKPHHRYVSNIHNPSLTVFLPPSQKANGAALVICPGGGHRFLSIDHEGYDVARWLNDQGVAGFVLKYRLANESGSKYKVDIHALADARRALRLVRSRANEWHVDPQRIGLMGFSAGGELAILAGTRFQNAQSTASDPIDRFNARPNFLALIYPGFKPGSINVTKETPPSFLAVADDDMFCAPASMEFYQALRKAGVSGEIHVYARGGHGFGIEPRHLPITSWTLRLRDWMDDRGYLTERQ